MGQMTSQLYSGELVTSVTYPVCYYFEIDYSLETPDYYFPGFNISHQVE